MPEPSAYTLHKRGGQKSIPLAIRLAAESYFDLPKAWCTRKVDELPSFALVAVSKFTNFTTGIDTHARDVILQPCEKFVALTGRLFSAYSEHVVDTQCRFYES